MKCRFCCSELKTTFIDLGFAPPSNAYVSQDELHLDEKKYKLRVFACDECWLVQTDDYAGREELFDENYAYFSSYSTSWLEHAKNYVEHVSEKYFLSKDSFVVEVACNDGYLLQYFKEINIKCLGVEPTYSTAEAARKKGISVLEDFFGEGLATAIASRQKADLIIANNVLAHVPDIRDFVKGFSVLLDDKGISTFEFPHLLELIKGGQFDTIYHEHFSYLSLTFSKELFSSFGLEIFNVERLSTHGGSLRVYVQHSKTGINSISTIVNELIAEEYEFGLSDRNIYLGFQSKAEKIKADFRSFIFDSNQNGKKVVAYGAAAKGNTLLNFSEISKNDIEFVVDLNPAKHGRFMPGSRIPIVEEKMIKESQPDYVVILPWNLCGEIVEQLSYIRAWGGEFVIAVPELRVF